MTIEDAQQAYLTIYPSTRREEGRDVVLGAGRPLGDAVVQKLASHSRKLTAVILEGDAKNVNAVGSFEEARADPTKSESIAQACSEAGTIFDCYDPDYASLKAWPEITSNIVYASIQVNVPLVFASHLRNSESDNSALEDEVLRAHRSGLTGTVVARLPQLFGRRVINPLWKLIYDSVIAGKKAHWVGDPSVPRSLLDVDDAASAMVQLAGNPSAYGRAWNIASPEPITGRKFAELAFRAVGLEPNVGSWGRGIVLTGGLLSSDAWDVLKLPYDYYSPFVLDGMEFMGAFPSARFTAPQDSISNGLEWYKDWKRHES